MLSHIVAEPGDYQATEIAAELMAKLYAASRNPCLLPFPDRDRLQLFVSAGARDGDQAQVVKRLRPRGDYSRSNDEQCLGTAWATWRSAS
ncbi:aminoglycoside phosphotransferase family protein [Escherichia coli]|uniref:aminoglycoside phosphotransferase family protein n=1 Tax=Escherichia coli TaxID=562 RepID=UPI0038D3B1BE